MKLLFNLVIIIRKEFVIPEKVNIEVKDMEIIVKGPKGELRKTFDDPRYNKSISIEKADGKMVISCESEKRKIRAMVGTIASHARNMSIGVTNGFEQKMKIFYSHFPITAEVKGNVVHIKNFLGEKSIRSANIAGKTKVDVKKDDVILSGIDKEGVGETASNIERACRLSKRDRRIFFDGIYISK
ncbi:MAG: 50S ribosomal protein L6 [Candidatus Aenigmarchaeota archaeon]|nr:50S ribosomal protein L6 [Candidatus Aenigmarchaeota archaeon]